MKKPATLILMFMLGSDPTAAMNILRGNQELGISGQVDVDSFDGTFIECDLSYGYFWLDFLELGARVGISDSDSLSQWRIGGFTEYHFFNETPLVPFVGASADLAGADIDFSGNRNSDETAVVIGLDAGVKYFLTDGIALSGQVVFDAATGDIFATEDGPEHTNWDIQLGLRFFF